MSLFGSSVPKEYYDCSSRTVPTSTYVSPGGFRAATILDKLKAVDGCIKPMWITRAYLSIFRHPPGANPSRVAFKNQTCIYFFISYQVCASNLVSNDRLVSLHLKTLFVTNGCH